MSKKFEAHITVGRMYYHSAKEIADTFGWSMSNISDDIVLGPGRKAYLTKHEDNFETIHHEMSQVVEALQDQKIPVIRMKIEAILIDVVFK